MAKEGTLSGTVTYAGTHKIIPLDKERFVMVYENMGGTGKFKGIEGNMEYNRRNMRPVEKGTHQAISRGKGTWKIVEPKK